MTANTNATTSTKNASVIDLGQLLAAEREYMIQRRQQAGRSANIEADSLAIALSGGGIRSATVCLGIVEQLNEKELLGKTDYLSTVSGGGYLGAYIHSSLQQKDPDDFQQLFQPGAIKHLRDYRRYLYVFNGNKFQRRLSQLWLLCIALFAMVSNWLWLLLPAGYLWWVNSAQHPQGIEWWWPLTISLSLLLLAGFFIKPNHTSPHQFYKRRLRKAYIHKNEKIKLWQLDNPLAPYPLINATVHVNYDKYASDKISYRGRIKTNYFLFSPLYCGSQVTGFVTTNNPNYKSISLATAMATSAAAVNSFMGNASLPAGLRFIMVLLNLRTGILAANPQLEKRKASFWPYYTWLELLGNPSTTSYRVQVSDGGHVENLGVYELLRRKVKVIIAVDAGQDDFFSFYDLRNLVVRSRRELGVEIFFHENADPQQLIRPNAASGFSRKNLIVAQIKGMKGSYSEDYNGVLVYIKSSLLPSKEFALRRMKKDVKALGKKGETAQAATQKRQLDSYMYRTYNPGFPHESTADQFFDEAQWDAYHELGRDIGTEVCEALGLENGDGGAALFQKCKTIFENY